MIRFLDLSVGSSSSVLNKLRLSERRKQHENQRTINTTKRLNSKKNQPYFDVHLSALRFFSVFSLGVFGFLAEFCDVLHHLQSLQNPVLIQSKWHSSLKLLCICLSNLSKCFSLIFFASILGQFLQGSSSLGPLLHFDEAGQQADKQKESQQTQQCNDSHIEWLQPVGYMVP